ncbi:MAG: LuxR C-terminal-related transcriptional regulator [Caldilineaceae bacterium]
MTAPLLVTKLLPPTLVPATLPRQHLFDLLNRGGYSRFFLICAPAGYGKTTLLRSWLEKKQWGDGEVGKWGEKEVTHLPIFPSPHFSWLTLDPADNDPRRFLTYFLAALRSLAPEIGSSIEPLLAGPQLPPLENIFIVLLNEIAAHSSPILLALDDYHEIANEVIHTGLAFLIDNSPANLQVAMTSRSEPPLPLSRWRVRRQMIELNAADLRFSTDEAIAFLQNSIGITPTQAIAPIIESKIEGWAAGLQLAALSLQGRRVEQPEQLTSFLEEFSGDHRFVFDYLANEVLHQQPEEVRSFLLQTASLDRLCAALCNDVTQRNDSAQLLSYLEQSGLFLTRIGERGDWFRYHTLFAEFLRAQFSDKQPELEVRAAQWFAQESLWPEAIRHALASGNFHFAGRQIANAIGYALANGLIGELAGWLEALPDAQIRADYELSVAKAWTSYLMGQMAQAIDYLESGLMFQPTNLPAEDEVAATALRGFLAAAQRDFTGALAYCQKALAAVGEGDLPLRSIILLNLAQVQWWLGNPAALQTAAEAKELSERTGNLYGAMNALGTETQILLILGRLNEAKHLCEKAILTYTLPSGTMTPLAAIPLVNLGLVLVEQGDFAKAEGLLRQGIELSYQSGSYVPLLSGNLVLIRTLQALGHNEETFALLYELKEAAKNFGAEMLVDTLEAEIRLTARDFVFVQRWVERLGLQVSDTPDYTQETIYILYSRWLISQNQHEVALPLLQRLEQSAHQNEHLGIELHALILQGIIFQLLDQRSAAQSALQTALHLAAPEAYRYPFFVHLRTIAPMLTALQAENQPFVASLFATTPPPTAQLPDSSGAPSSLSQALASELNKTNASTLLEPLSDRELDVLRLLAAGLSNPEIADKLIVGVGTVKTHVHNILGKLGVRNRIEAIDAAKQLGLI